MLCVISCGLLMHGVMLRFSRLRDGIDENSVSSRMLEEKHIPIPCEWGCVSHVLGRVPALELLGRDGAV